MNRKQKKLIEIWFVIISLFVFVGIFENNYSIAILAFIPVSIYVALNYNTIKRMEEPMPSIKDTILENNILKYYSFIHYLVVIIIAFYFVISGKNPGNHVLNLWVFSLIVLGPLLPALLATQISLFKVLGNEKL